jgi:predicted amidohydrolase
LSISERLFRLLRILGLKISSKKVSDRIFLGIDSIQIFLNAYTYCASNRDRAYNLLQDEGQELAYNSKTKELLEMLYSDVPVYQLRSRIESDNDDQSLLGALALSTALARYLANKHETDFTRYLAPFRNSAGEGYWLAIEGAGPFQGRILSPPRTLDQIGWTLYRIREPLLVTPTRLKEWRLTRIQKNQELDNWFDKRMRNGIFRVAISSLSAEAKIEGVSSHYHFRQPPFKFHLTAIEPEQEQLNFVKAALARAHSKGASILVLPELRMPPPLLRAVKDFLAHQEFDDDHGLVMVVAGSWHVDEEKKRYNRCIILTQDGDEFWQHDKLREYVISAKDVQSAPDFFRLLGVGEGGASEAIHRGTELQFYDSVVGRLAVAICIGFFSPEIESLLQTSEANVFLVPAMSPSMTALEARATALVHTQHACTFAANCGCMIQKNKAFSFYQLPTLHATPARAVAGEQMLVYELLR